MKTYEFILKPLSGFGTPLKGDTIFGQFCWQLLENEYKIGKSLDHLLSAYDREPFIVFSSAVPRYKSKGKYHYAFRFPTVPKHLTKFITENEEKGILKKKNIFLSVQEGDKFPDLKRLHEDNIIANEIEIDDENIGSFASKIEINYTQWHNTIDRRYWRTTGDRFAPFAKEQIVHHPGIELSLFIGVEEDIISIEKVKDILSDIGRIGFGRDASTGLGKFKILSYKEKDLFNFGNEPYNACYTLAPCLPEKNTIDKTKSYFSTFIRYGRHGNTLARSSNPFKNPVVMISEGAVITPLDKESFKIPYIGKAIYNVSKVEPKTVVQGYSLYIPVNLEDNQYVNAKI